MKKQIDDEGWETNRYKKLRITRKSCFYCNCDREMLGVGEKCTCKKHRNRQTRIGGGKRKLKKY